MDLQTNSYKNIYKADIYKVDSHKTDTFFVHQINILPKITPCKADPGQKKNIFRKEMPIYFSLNCYLLRSLFSTLSITFFTLFPA